MHALIEKTKHLHKHLSHVGPRSDHGLRRNECLISASQRQLYHLLYSAPFKVLKGRRRNPAVVLPTQTKKGHNQSCTFSGLCTPWFLPQKFNSAGAAPAQGGLCVQHSLFFSPRATEAATACWEGLTLRVPGVLAVLPGPFYAGSTIIGLYFNGLYQIQSNRRTVPTTYLGQMPLSHCSVSDTHCTVPITWCPPHEGMHMVNYINAH